MRTENSRTWVACAAVALVNALILWHFHDRHWYPSDEGIYATIAERVLSGEVMNRDVQNFHPGYGDFINVAAFRLFGVDLLSLRYPLVLAALVQSVAVFALLGRRSLLLAVCGSLTATALGVIQFLNPSPHWYCLSLTTVLLCWLAEMPRAHWARVVGAGMCIGVLGFLRQLTGVFVTMGVLVYLLEEASSDARGRDAWLARAMLCGLLVTLTVYLAFSRGIEPGGLVLFASWPLALIVLALRRTRTPNRETVLIATRLAVGAIVAALPLLAYGLSHGSIQPWFNDTVLAAIWLPRLDVFDAGAWYAALPVVGLYRAMFPATPWDVPNGLYWAVLPVLASVNGILTLASLRRERTRFAALQVVAAFYALVVLYMQDAIYLYFTAGMSLTAVFWSCAARTHAHRWACVAIGLLLTVVGVTSHAAQPFTRSNDDLLRGHRTVQGRFADPFPRATLRLEAAEQAPYRQLAEIIRSEAPAGSAVFAVPSDAELYFLSARRNPFRFYNTALGVRTDAELAAVLGRLQQEPPAVITFRPGDKYNTWTSLAIMQYVRSHYERIVEVGGIEIYRLRTGRRS